MRRGPEPDEKTSSQWLKITQKCLVYNNIELNHYELNP